MRYTTVSPPYKPPRQAQSLFDFYQRLDRYSEMLIWWKNINLSSQKKPLIELTTIVEKRNFALNYQKQEVETG